MLATSTEFAASIMQPASAGMRSFISRGKWITQAMSGIFLECILALSLCCVLLTCNGQGLDVTTGDSLGGNSRVQGMDASWQLAQASAKEFTNRWANRRKSVLCSAKGTGMLCGVSTASSSTAAALRVASSPVVYDTRDPAHTGGLNLAPLPKDQGDCNLCVAYAVSAAAQAAAASALHRSTADVTPISVRQLHFCAPGTPNDCTSGWKLQSALRVLSEDKFPDGLVASQCLPMLDTAKMESLSDKDVCKPLSSCTVTPPLGTYTYTKTVPLVEVWQIQDHIRQHGASVVTRVTLPPGFKEWFNASPSRHTAVYDNPSASNDIVTVGGVGTNHAVVIAGYNNKESWWLIWSSWGSGWADGGFAKVKYGQLGIGDPSFTYGVIFNPVNQPVVKLPVKQSEAPGCVWYTVQPGDYVSKIADVLGISIESLVQSNTQVVGGLNDWLKPGTQIQACGIKPVQGPKLPDTVWGKDASKANVYCISPAYKLTTCGWASEAELEATTGSQCPYCGTLYTLPPKKLPGKVMSHINYNQWAVQTVSMACQGRVVIRAVFKILKEPSEYNGKPSNDGKDCTNARMTHVDDKLAGEGGEASAVVRCELKLPPGPGLESDRALRSKEVNCFLCGYCNQGRGCPSKVGVWYSDSYTTRTTGCDFNPSKGYYAHRAGININPRTEILLAKFEVCNNPGCYDPVYEDNKLRTAGQCVNGHCGTGGSSGY